MKSPSLSAVRLGSQNKKNWLEKNRLNKGAAAIFESLPAPPLSRYLTTRFSNLEWNRWGSAHFLLFQCIHSFLNAAVMKDNRSEQRGSEQQSDQSANSKDQLGQQQQTSSSPQQSESREDLNPQEGDQWNNYRSREMGESRNSGEERNSL